MTKSRVVTLGAGQRATRKNTHTDRLVGHGSVAMHASEKRQGAGKANWGRPGDEIFEAPIDEFDPSYDSADELFERAFGESRKNTQFDWAAVTDLSEEDDCAMNEIEEAMRNDWMANLEREHADIEDEGEAFFVEM